MVRYSFPFSFASKTHGDDITESWGSANEAQMLWETADANSHVLVLALPEGDATNSPVLAIGNKTTPSIINADLAFFDGLNSPILATVSSSNLRYAAILHDGTDMQILINAGRLKLNSSIMERKAADVASAANITLSDGGNFWDITGTTQIDTIASSGWIAGSVVRLQFDGIVTVKHATAGAGAQFFLNGSGDFTSGAGDVLTLIYDGTYWKETSRMVA